MSAPEQRPQADGVLYAACRIESCNDISGDVYGMCARHCQTAWFYPECGSVHRWDMQHYTKVNIDGSSRCVLICEDCRATVNRKKCSAQKTHAVIHDGRRENHTPECEVHGCPSHDTQLHHWAPQALFDDAGDWPRSWLCRSHHQRWHQTTGTNRRLDVA